jgi:hypothetical protein
MHDYHKAAFSIMRESWPINYVSDLERTILIRALRCVSKVDMQFRKLLETTLNSRSLWQRRRAKILPAADSPRFVSASIEFGATTITCSGSYARRAEILCWQARQFHPC